MELLKVVFGEYETPSGDMQLSIDHNDGKVKGFFEDEDKSLYEFEVKNNKVEWYTEPFVGYLGEIEAKIYNYIESINQ